MSGEGLAPSFGPAMQLAWFFSWMRLSVLGLHVVRDAFNPPACSFGEAPYLAGTAITTLCFAIPSLQASHPCLGRPGGFCDLTVMTMTVTYLRQIQPRVATRDPGVLKLTMSAGHPPSALVLLERYAALDSGDEPAALLRNARDRCAAVLQGHASHPSLIYFRSTGVASARAATLGAV